MFPHRTQAQYDIRCQSAEENNREKRAVNLLSPHISSDDIESTNFWGFWCLFIWISFPSIKRLSRDIIIIDRGVSTEICLYGNPKPFFFRCGLFKISGFSLTGRCRRSEKSASDSRCEEKSLILWHSISRYSIKLTAFDIMPICSLHTCWIRSDSIHDTHHDWTNV